MDQARYLRLLDLHEFGLGESGELSGGDLLGVGQLIFSRRGLEFWLAPGTGHAEHAA